MNIEIFIRLCILTSIALVVRFITSRFIGDYDSSVDKVYNYRTFIDNEMVSFEIIDSPGVRNVSNMRLNNDCLRVDSIGILSCSMFHSTAGR